MTKRRGCNRKYRGQQGLWHCVTCGLIRRCTDTLLLHGWLSYRGGRICGGCLRELDRRPVGTTIQLGNGVRLVKAGESRA